MPARVGEGLVRVPLAGSCVRKAGCVCDWGAVCRLPGAEEGAAGCRRAALAWRGAAGEVTAAEVTAGEVTAAGALPRAPSAAETFAGSPRAVIDKYKSTAWVRHGVWFLGWWCLGKYEPR